VTIMDVDEGRVAYALANNFATHGYVVSKPLHSSASSSSIFSSVNSHSGVTTPSSDGSMTPLGTYERLQGAKSVAADVLAIARPDMPALEEDEDDGVDVTFECTGKEACMQTSLYATRPGGKVIMVGMGTPIQTVPLSVAHLREVDILGIFRYANTYKTGIRLLSAGKDGRGGLGVSLEDMVTHRFKGLEGAKDAFEIAGRTVDNEGRLVLKVVIEA
jgi:L-iditol 2-dehydrogenase